MDYQKNTEHIGSSDIGILILSGFERGKGFQLKKLFFGEDGTYSAYIVNGQTHLMMRSEIPMLKKFGIICVCMAFPRKEPPVLWATLQMKPLQIWTQHFWKAVL